MLEPIQLMLRRGELTIEQMMYAISFGSGALRGRRIVEIQEPDPTGTVSEATLVWRVEATAGLPERPQIQDPHHLDYALDQFLMLVNDPEVAEDDKERNGQVLWLAQCFGPLALCKHKLPFAHSQDCIPTHEELVGDWVGWAAVYQAALEGRSIPEPARTRLELHWEVPAHSLIEWLAQGHGFRANSPEIERDFGLFPILAEALKVRRKAAELRVACDGCGAPFDKESIDAGAKFCSTCQKKRIAGNRRAGTARKRDAEYMLRCIVAYYGGGNQALERVIIREIAEDRDVLRESHSDGPRAAAIRAQARKRLEKLENPLRKGQKR